MKTTLLSLDLILFLVVILVLSFGATALIRRLAIRRHILDIPNHRSSHDRPTPRGGGLAIVVAWFLGITFLFIQNRMDPHLYYAFLPGLLLAAIGVLDDILGVKPLIRLLLQLLTAVSAVYLLEIQNSSFTVFGLDISFLLFPIAVFGIVWFVNLFNFLDGIDSYASMETLFVAGSLYLFAPSLSLLVLIAAVLGFAWWNLPRAKIFMGDVGSTQLGYILAVYGLYFFRTGEFHILHWLMLTSVFWFDATLTLIRRFFLREKLQQAHRKHAYQRIVQYGFSHGKTVLLAFAINVLILVLIFTSRRINNSPSIFFMGTVLLLYMIVRLVDNRFPFQADES